MKIQLKTLVLLILAGGMLASGYLVGPAPASTAGTIAVGAAVATPKRAAPPPATQLASTVKVMRPPVPLQLGAHDEYFVSAPADAVATQASAAAPALGAIGDKPLVDDQVSADLSAKAMIEQDGYRNVRALVKGADGSWHGKAMRGATEIAVSVDAAGSVSTN
jgi:hypothetical protein